MGEIVLGLIILLFVTVLLFVKPKEFCFEWNREINVLFQDNLLDVKNNDFVFKSKVNYYSSCDIPTGLKEILFYERNAGFRPF